MLGHRRMTGVFLASAFLALVTSCTSLIPPLQPAPSEPGDVGVIRNYRPLDMSLDEFPLFVGASWTYRNATPDVNPEIHAGSVPERQVVAVVYRHDEASKTAHECYVLRIRDGSKPTVLCYLHRSPEGVHLYGIEILPYAGAPELIPCDGQTYCKLPFRKDDQVSFSLYEGTKLNSQVLRQELVAVSATAQKLLGPYSSNFGEAWRVHSEYAGTLADVFGRGIEETWYAPGIGLVRRTAESLVYEVVRYRGWEEAALLTEKSKHGPYSLPVDSVVAVQLRGAKPTATEGFVWDFANRAEVAFAGVLSPLSEDSYSGPFFADINNVGRLETGSYVYLFQVRTNGEASLVFEKRDIKTGDHSQIRFDFGSEQPMVLSDPRVKTMVQDDDHATVTFSVHYRDEDGTPPTLAKVCIDGTQCYDMTFRFGKLADGSYTSAPIPIESGLHRYCFRFSDDEGAVVEQTECLLEHVFDVGGPIP